MTVDLFIKKVPVLVKELISREANDHRRSINQEAIALLEEALALRAGSTEFRRSELQKLLEVFASQPHPATAAEFPVTRPASLAD